MRDLTLRSAASFGSFHLIRLLYDEYIFYLIEQRIAKATRTTPLQMLGDVIGGRDRSSSDVFRQTRNIILDNNQMETTGISATTTSVSISSNSCTMAENLNQPIH